MIYSVEETRRETAPVAEEYGFQEVHLFGSYACSETTEQGDEDILCLSKTHGRKGFG